MGQSTDAPGDLRIGRAESNALDSTDEETPGAWGFPVV